MVPPARALRKKIYICYWTGVRSVLGRYWQSSFFFGTSKKKKERDQYLPNIQTEQASSIKDLLLWLLTNLRKASLFLLVSARYRQESENKVSTSCKTILSSKIFPRHHLVRSFRELSILAIRIGKFGPLRELIRKLLFSADQKYYLFAQYREYCDHQLTRK